MANKLTDIKKEIDRLRTTPGVQNKVVLGRVLDLMSGIVIQLISTNKRITELEKTTERRR